MPNISISNRSHATLRNANRSPTKNFVWWLAWSTDANATCTFSGIAPRSLRQSSDPEEVIRHIAAQRAVSVIAHPKNDFFPWIESFDTLPLGIETWNTKYDGRYAPRPGTFALLQRLKQRAPEMHAFYGQDLHWKKQYRGLRVVLDCDSLEPDPAF